jgi:nucleotide-binding universal stress UspA family protein
VAPVVVIGTDGSPGGDAALGFAFEEAQLRGLSLRIVCAWQAPDSSYVGEAFAPTTDAFLEAEQHAEAVLRAALAQLRPESALGAEALAIEGHPAAVLIEQAQDAALLVVGSRGRGTTASLLLGSVSQGVAHHAHCPLVIVPPGNVSADRSTL